MLRCGRVFSMPDLWSFISALVSSLPSVESLCAAGSPLPDRFSACGLVYDRVPWSESDLAAGSHSDSDVANLADLAAFDPRPAPRLPAPLCA